MTVELKPRLPCWASGLDLPREGEGFRDYWTRMMVPADVIDRALDVRNPDAVDVANDRIADWLRRQNPRLFDAYVDLMLSRTAVTRPRYTYRP